MKRIDEKYEVLRELGAGGMGAVYEARHEHTSRRVAVKIIKDEARFEHGAVERFQREARAAGAIESEHITDVLDSGIDRESGAPYLVMELLSGEDLSDAFKRIGPFPPDVAVRIVAQMLMGLERAHEAGVVHRDIKPANVFLAKKDKDSTALVVKVGDFGVAKVKPNALAEAEGHALTQTSALLGSPIYMSPEQAKGSRDVDARSDLWSTGVVLYQLLTGETPHPDADTLGLLLLSICSEQSKPVRTKAPWVSPQLDAIVARALEIDADARFQSARVMLDALLSTLPSKDVSLDASMLVPLDDEARKPIVVATALATTVPETKPETKPELAASDFTSTRPPALDAAPSPKRARWPFAAAVIAGFAVVSAAIVAVTSNHDEAKPLPPSGASSVVATSSVPTAKISAEPEPRTSASSIAVTDTGKDARAKITGAPKPRSSSAASARPGAVTTTAPITPPPSAAPSASVFREFR